MWRLLVPVDLTLARSVVEQKPCLLQLLLAGCGKLLLVSIAKLAGMFRHSLRLEGRYQLSVVCVPVKVDEERDWKVSVLSCGRPACNTRLLTPGRRCLNLLMFGYVVSNAGKYDFIYLFYFAVGLRMVHCGRNMPDSEKCARCCDELTHKQCSIFGKEIRRNAIKNKPVIR